MRSSDLDMRWALFGSRWVVFSSMLSLCAFYIEVRSCMACVFVVYGKITSFGLFCYSCVARCDIPCVFMLFSRGSWYRAAREARDVNQMLVYVQAIDVPRKDGLSTAELRRALQRLSMTETGNQMGMLPLYIGMMVRLTTKLSAAHRLMQDSVGTVVGIQFHEQEFVGRVQDDWRGNGAHDSWRRGYYKTRKMIKAVYVKFEDYDIDSGYGAGVVSVEPRSASWKFKTHDDLNRRRRDVPMTRIQLPLAPARVRTVQTAQGMSMNAANMNLTRPPTMSSDDDYWLHLYVMLSRVRTVGRLLLFGMPEQGFPTVVYSLLSVRVFWVVWPKQFHISRS